jgi:predicted phage terminase large subunit-like protein
VFFDNIRKEALEKGLYLPLEAVVNTKNKQGRIEAVQPLTFNSKEHSSIIKFRDDWLAAYPKLMDQLIRFPLKSEHDDAPDAMVSCIEMIRKPSRDAAQKPFIVGGG